MVEMGLYYSVHILCEFGRDGVFFMGVVRRWGDQILLILSAGACTVRGPLIAVGWITYGVMIPSPLRRNKTRVVQIGVQRRWGDDIDVIVQLCVCCRDDCTAPLCVVEMT